MRKGWTILQALTISLKLSLVELPELPDAGSCWLMLISRILILITAATDRRRLRQFEKIVVLLFFAWLQKTC